MRPETTLLCLVGGAALLSSVKRGSGAKGRVPLDLAADFTVGEPGAGVTFSNDGTRHGMSRPRGLTPDGRNVAYQGFVVWLTPGEFLRLNRPLPKGKVARRHFDRQDPRHPPRTHDQATYAFPQLYVDVTGEAWDMWSGDGPVPGPADLRVYNHEGRHRMTLVQEVAGGGHLVPVTVHPRGLRARHFDPRHLLHSTLVPEKYADSDEPVPVRILSYGSDITGGDR